MDMTRNKLILSIVFLNTLTNINNDCQRITNGLASVGRTDAMHKSRCSLPAFAWLTGLRPVNRPNAKPQTVKGKFEKTNEFFTI